MSFFVFPWCVAFFIESLFSLWENFIVLFEVVGNVAWRRGKNDHGLAANQDRYKWICDLWGCTVHHCFISQPFLLVPAFLMAWSKFVSTHLPLSIFNNGTCCNPAALPFATDGDLILQTWPPRRPVAQQGHLRTLGRRLSLHPYLWHGIRLSVVSTPLSLYRFPLPVYMLSCSDFLSSSLCM